MAIAIPTIVDAQIAALRADLEPNVDGATNTASSPRPPIVEANRIADLIGLLTDLMDSGTLTVEGLHKVADSTNNTTEADATDLSEAQTLLNALKTDANAHFVIVGANEHVGADVTNSIDSANATNQATAETLANELKADINAHRALAAATGHYVADPDNAITAADASDLPTLLTLANEIKAQYNAHIASINGAGTLQVNDRTAFTTVGSLVGCTITFGAATTTVALRGVSATVASHTASVLTLSAALPAAPVEADVFTLAFSAVDVDLDVLRQDKGLGDMGSNPYVGGPSLLNAAAKLLELLGATRQTLDSGTTDGAGDNNTLVEAAAGLTIDAHINQWAFADDAGTLDVDNLRRISDNTASDIVSYNAFQNAAGAATTPGAGTAWEIRDKQIYTGTAAAGAAASLTCPATISFATNELIGLELVIVSGTGVGQRRRITGNTGGVSSVISVGTDWLTNPDGTSVFEIRSDVMPQFMIEGAVEGAEPFGLLSPHGGGNGQFGHGGATLVSDMLQHIRDMVAAYTVPA
jgi:hypothetical protein